MAGAGYKLFNTGDVLLASEVNTYLMQQTVMVFANASARTTALSGVLAEGMVSYLQDTNVVEIYNGSAWASLDDPNAIQNTIVDAKGDLISATADNTPARLASSGNNGDVLTIDTSTSTGLKWAAPAGGGKVLQVVYADYSGSTVVASTTYADTGLSASITPSATNSKILVLVSQQFYAYRASNETGHALKLFRGATEIFKIDGTSSYQAGIVFVNGVTGVGIGGTDFMSYLDSPNTTSSTTYKTQGRAYISTSSGQVTYQDGSSKSSITLLEIGA